MGTVTISGTSPRQNPADYHAPAVELTGAEPPTGLKFSPRLTADQHSAEYPNTHFYPRPQLQRDGWTPLNGAWDFSLDPEAAWKDPVDVEWQRTIVVPYSPETLLSGVNDAGLYAAVWYRRSFFPPETRAGERVFLHFGAVDYIATVWVNGVKVYSHEGGYTPFKIDISDVILPASEQTVVVRAEDDPLDLAKPRGKQDWKLEPHSIWYPRTTGIWQTVWLEVVPQSYVETLRWNSNLERWEVEVEAHIGGTPAKGLKLSVRLHVGEQVFAEDSYSVVEGEVHRRIALSDPGIDDYRNVLLWSPSSPTLIDVEMELRDSQGNVLDQIRSYTAMRTVTVNGDRFLLNSRPFNLKLVLDQGYWPESGLTAPSDEALRRDVVLAKELGFNGVRKHQKIEDPRYLYWADRLGLMVWEELPSAYRHTRQSVERLAQQWTEVINRDSSHPCIVAWVPFNESWGVPDLPTSAAQQSCVRALYYLTKTLDQTRPVIGNDGWESVATDIIGVHDYDSQPKRIAKRYGQDYVESRLFIGERPGGRTLVLDDTPVSNRPVMLTEFGGISLSHEQGSWGYSHSDTPTELLDRYRQLLYTVCSLPRLAGFCYTQFTDTYQETNGLLYADRTPKAPVDQIAKCTNGIWPELDRLSEANWREHMREIDPTILAPEMVNT